MYVNINCGVQVDDKQVAANVPTLLGSAHLPLTERFRQFKQSSEKWAERCGAVQGSKAWYNPPDLQALLLLDHFSLERKAGIVVDIKKNHTIAAI